MELRIDQPKRSTSSDNGNDAGQRQLAVLDADPDHFVNMKVYREFDGVVNAGTVVSTDEDIATGRTLWSVQYDDGVQAEKDLSVRTCFELHNRHAAPAYGKKVLGKWHPLLDFLVLIPWGLMISYDPLGALLPTDGSAVASTSDSVVELD